MDGWNGWTDGSSEGRSDQRNPVAVPHARLMQNYSRAATTTHPHTHRHRQTHRQTDTDTHTRHSLTHSHAPTPTPLSHTNKQRTCAS
jgi:hypothetical protein